VIARILDEAEGELEAAFNHYEDLRAGLGDVLLDEFRGALHRIIRHPGAWQRLDDRHRQFRLHRLPYGIIYRVDVAANKVLIVAVTHLSRAPGWWRGRDRQ
jgi:mRNA-degrading endonuclease RelE of RelBE toxin-antitoxin system